MPRKLRIVFLKTFTSEPQFGVNAEFGEVPEKKKKKKKNPIAKKRNNSRMSLGGIKTVKLVVVGDGAVGKVS
jgi:hypothetical protein